MAIGLIIDQAVPGVGPQEAMIAEEQVHVDRAADIGLSMVAEDHERRLIEFAVTANRFDDHGEFLVVFSELRFDEIVIDSVLMPNRIQIAHLNEHQVYSDRKSVV